MTGGFAAEVGGALSSAVAANTLSSFAAGAIQVGAYAAFGGTTSYLTGGSFLSGALTGAAGSAMGSLTGLIPGIQTNGWGTAVQVGSSAAFGGIVADLSGGNFWRGAAQAAIIAGFNHAAHRMGENIFKIANNLEEIIDQLNEHKVGENISGKEISNLNPKLSKADLGIKYLTKTNTGFKLKLTWFGRTLLDASGNQISDNSDFIVNKLYNAKDKFYNVLSPGNNIMYNRKLEKFNIYINNNQYSIYKNFKNFTRAW